MTGRHRAPRPNPLGIQLLWASLGIILLCLVIAALIGAQA